MGTVRQLRSAASQHFRLDMIFAFPDTVYLDQSRCALRTTGVCPTDSLESTMFQRGFSARIGTSSSPSKALLSRHILSFDRSLETQYQQAPSLLARYEVCMAGAANAIAWLAWLRGTELFSLGPDDVEITTPGHGALHDLPSGIGVLQLRLLPETKSNRTSQADVVIAYLSAMGICAGVWLTRLLAHRRFLLPTSSWLFHFPNGSQWTSTYFHHTYLFPSLTAQRLAGDAYLRPYDGSKGMTLAEHFWSMHSYRRGGRTQVSKMNNGALRTASHSEVAEHGRWRLKPGSADMPFHYNEWTVADRLAITLLCM